MVVLTFHVDVDILLEDKKEFSCFICEVLTSILTNEFVYDNVSVKEGLVMCRYVLDNDGRIKDTVSGFVLPDNYWIVDLLNLKEEQINELKDLYESS